MIVEKLGEFSYLPQLHQIEITNICNLKCPMCRTVDYNGKKGYIDVELIKKIIAERDLDNTPYIELQMSGEPTLHPKLEEIIDLLHSSKTWVGLSTNLTTAKKTSHILSKLDYLTVSVDSLIKEEYETMRYPQKFKTFKENLDYLLKNCDAKIIALQLVKTKYNFDNYDQQMNELEKYVKQYNKKNILIRGVEECFELMMDHDEKIFSKGLQTDNLCLNPFMSVSVKWDGLVVPCCYDFFNEITLGDLNKNSLREIWNNLEIEKLRYQTIYDKNKRPNLCKNCYHKSPILLIQNFINHQIKYGESNGN